MFIQVTNLTSGMTMVINSEDISAMFALEQVTKDGVKIFTHILLRNGQTCPASEHIDKIIGMLPMDERMKL